MSWWGERPREPMNRPYLRPVGRASPRAAHRRTNLFGNNVGQTTCRNWRPISKLTAILNAFGDFKPSQTQPQPFWAQPTPSPSTTGESSYNEPDNGPKPPNGFDVPATSIPKTSAPTSIWNSTTITNAARRQKKVKAARRQPKLFPLPIRLSRSNRGWGEG